MEQVINAYLRVANEYVAQNKYKVDLPDAKKILIVLGALTAIATLFAFAKKKQEKKDDHDNDMNDYRSMIDDALQSRDSKVEEEERSYLR